MENERIASLRVLKTANFGIARTYTLHDAREDNLLCRGLSRLMLRKVASVNFSIPADFLQSSVRIVEDALCDSGNYKMTARKLKSGFRVRLKRCDLE